MLKLSMASGHGCLPSCFSSIEILFAIYYVMKHDPKNPTWDKRDIFILSKGHAALAHYYILAEFKYFDKKLIDSYGSAISIFGCHADRTKIPGVELSTGSLGHGIGVAVGFALAFKIKGQNRKVFTIIGDGESNEGTVWESIMVAVNLKLGNLTIVYDNNMSHSKGLQIHDPEKKFKAFGCDVVSVNGHDLTMLKKELRKNTNTVRVIIADTKKGFNCKTLVENHYEWHRKSPNKEQLDKLIGELCEETI